METEDLILNTSFRELKPLTLENQRVGYYKRIKGNIKTIRSKIGIKGHKRRKFQELDDVNFLYIVGKNLEIIKIKKNALDELIGKKLRAFKEFQDELN